jgi:hypothetical protein
MDLKRKVGPLPLWGWVVVVGGGIGMIVLIRKSKSGEKESEPILSKTSAGALPETGAGGGSGSTAGDPEVKTPAEVQPAASPTPATSPTYEQGGFASEVNDVREGKESIEALVGPVVGPTPKPAGKPAVDRHAATGGNPRAGKAFKTVQFRGQTAHQYAHAVAGGVGPHKNIIILPIGKKNHAAKGKHEPAHAKTKGKPKPAPHPQPAHHAAAPPRRPAPKRKAKARR